jgi:hypothetical protein
VTGSSTNAHLFEFMLGEWDIEFDRLPEGAMAGRRATVHSEWILDHTAIFDEIRHLDEAGTVNFRGATFRTYVPDQDFWYVLWMTPAIEGFSEIHACGDETNEVRTSGKGKDPVGAFVEHGRYHEITDNAFSFELERSYENGPFVPFVSFRAARKRPSSLPIIACNLGALAPTERERRAALARSIVSQTSAVQELTDGYALQVPASTAAQALEWLLLERRCCSFFHLELELEPGEGAIWLRLRGGPGVKEFLEAAIVPRPRGTEG